MTQFEHYASVNRGLTTTYGIEKMASPGEIEKLERRWLENMQGLSFAPLAEAYRKAGRFDEAFGVLEAGLANHPDYVPAHIVQGRCHADTGAESEAASDFEAVLQRDSENVIALNGLAEIREREGRPLDAMPYLERLLEVDPSNAMAVESLERIKHADAAPAPIVPEEEPTDVSWEADQKASETFVPMSLLEEPDSPSDPAPFADTSYAPPSDEPASDVSDPQPSNEPLKPLETIESIEPSSVSIAPIELTPAAHNFFALHDDSQDLLAAIDAESETDIAEHTEQTEFTSKVFADPPSPSLSRPDTESIDGQAEVDEDDEERWMSFRVDDGASEPLPEEPSTVEGEAKDPRSEVAGSTAPHEQGAEEGPLVAQHEASEEVVPWTDTVPVDEEPEPSIAAGVEEWRDADSDTSDDFDVEWDDEVEEDGFEPDAIVPVQSLAPEESSVDSDFEEVKSETEVEVEAEAPDDAVSPVTFAWADDLAPDKGSVPEFQSTSPFEEDALAPEPEVKHEHEQHEVVADDIEEEASELVVTETMAEVFLRQGHVELALAVYTQLARRDPDNTRLQDAIARLAPEPSEGIAIEPSSADQEESVTGFAASDTGGESIGAFLGGILSARERVPPVAVTPPAVEQHPSPEPTKASTKQFSLESVFGDDPSARFDRDDEGGTGDSEAPPGGAEGFDAEEEDSSPSFDEFFAGGKPTVAPATGRRSGLGRDNEDLQEFNAWLKGLKR